LPNNYSPSGDGLVDVALIVSNDDGPRLVLECANLNDSKLASHPRGLLAASSVHSYSLSLVWCTGKQFYGPGYGGILKLKPQISRDYPLNLSILLSGGKEINKDSSSNGE
jgi:hypothetical protein